MVFRRVNWPVSWQLFIAYIIRIWQDLSSGIVLV